MDSGEQTSSASSITAPELKAPLPSTRVFKDECMFCFHSPYFEGGIYVCLQHYVGLCARHVKDYSEHNNGCKYFLRVQKFKVKPVENDEPVQTVAPAENDEPVEKKQCLSISAGKDEEDEKTSIVIAPNFTTDIPINQQTLDSHFLGVVQAVICHATVSRQSSIESSVSDWDDSERKLLNDPGNLLQLKVDKVIPYRGWVCEEPNCGLTENLWLNLSDGYILCGRAQYITENKMSKGNGHAKAHAEKFGFPVVVKLGTIHNGDGDVYSYAQDESVRDPFLKKHLAHFGLDINKFEKTEKSTFELELNLHQKWEWSRCQEDDAALETMYGSGFTGLINIGSSCYINSVIQTLLLDPVFVDAYNYQLITQVSGPRLIDFYNDFNFQLARLVHSLQSDEYSKEGFEHNGIKPIQFRRVAGHKHFGFSTFRQQDAGEYINHLFNKILETYEYESNPVDNYRFKLVTFLCDNASHKVHYQYQPCFILRLAIPDVLLKEDKIDKAAFENFGLKLPRFCIDLTTLINCFHSPQIIEEFVSPVTKKNKGAVQIAYLGTFPKFLFIQVNRYRLDDYGQTKKLDVDLNVPDELDLDSLRFDGPKSNEELLPEDEIPASTHELETSAINQELVQQIVDMGFPRRKVEIAVLISQNSNVDEIINYLFAYSEELQETSVTPLQDPDPTTSQASSSTVPKQELPCKNDGSSKYRLKGFITHMGSSPHSGHYVCHLRRNKVWYLYNDDKVAVSQNPPKALGYIYLYEQIND